MVKLFFVAAVLVVALVQIQGSEDVEEAWERFQVWIHSISLTKRGY